MQHRTIRGCPLEASSLCLGSMHLAREQEAFTLLDSASELEINFFDTADVYGENGSSEAILGRWSTLRKNRNRILITTKCGYGLNSHPSPDRHAIIASVNDSLKRLQTEYIDLYLIHIEHKRLPEQELLEAFELLNREGKILSFGAAIIPPRGSRKVFIFHDRLDSSTIPVYKRSIA